MLARGETSAGRVDVVGGTKKEERGDETTCGDHLASGVGEAVDLVDAEDNMVVMGEVTIFLLSLSMR